MTKKQIEEILFSFGGVTGVFVLLVAFNFISSFGKVRVDLTDEKLHTLSQGTRNILKDIEGEVEIRFYCTRDDNTPVQLKSYAGRVQDLLDEYRQVAGDSLRIKKFNPEPLSDAEDSAKMDGITPQMLSGGEQIYFGLAISHLDATETIPVLTMDRENLLEYDLSRAISNVLNADDRKQVGILSTLPIMGGPPSPQQMRSGQMQGTDPWTVVTILKQDFEVEEVPTSVEEIGEEIEVLLVVHPRELSDQTLFALDQFVLRGGKMIVLMDPMPIIDQSGVQQNMMGMNMSKASDLGKLLKAWGVEFDTSKVVADMNYTTQLSAGNGQVVTHATWLSLTPEALDEEDVVMSQIDSLLFPLPGHFTGTPAAGLKKDVLITSSKKSQMVERIIAQMSAQQVINDFASEDSEKALGIRLTGKFKSAFPDGPPAAPGAQGAEAAETPSADFLKVGAGENFVTLIGDADFIYDNFSVRVQNFFGQRLMSYMNGNLNLIQSLVEQMAGDSNLIGARSRAIQSRPFTVVKDLQAQAREQYQGKIKDREEKIQQLQQKLSDLQKQKSPDQQLILSTEQQEKIKEFQKEEAEQRQQLKEIRKELRKDIDKLENSIKFWNILGMPMLVTLLGIGMAVMKRMRTGAR